MSETKKGEHHIVALLTKLQTDSNLDTDFFISWLVRLMTAAGRFPGFWSGEIIPPTQLVSQWSLLQRFTSEEQAKEWQKSPARNKLLSELAASRISSSVSVSEEIALSENVHGTVAAAIVTTVKPGMEEDYYKWQSKIQQAQAKFPGYRGIYWQPPSPGMPDQWNSLLRFDSPDHLENWFESDERRQLLEEQAGLVEKTKFHKMTTAFPGWVPIDERTGEAPRNWKTAMLVFTSVFPVVMLSIRFLRPLEAGMNPVMAGFINIVGSIILTTLINMPRLVAIFRWWLLPEEPSLAVNLKGIGILLLVYVVEVLLLLPLFPT